MNMIHRCLIFALCVMVVFLEIGMASQFGAFYVKLLDKFQSSRAKTAAVQSTLLGVKLGLGVVNGFLVTKIGIHRVLLLSSLLVPAGFGASFFATRIEHLYITIDLIAGIGLSMTYITSTLLVGRIFTGRKRDLCLSLQTSSISLSGLVYPYFIEWLLNQYDLSWSFLILGAIYCNKFSLLIMCWANKTLIDNQVNTINVQHSEDIRTTETCSFKNSILKLRQILNLTYICLILGVALTISAINGYFGSILDISEWKGFNIHSSNGLIFVIFNVASLISRITPGILRQINGINSFICPIISTILGFLGHFILYTGNIFSTFALSTGLSGVALGVVLSSQHILLMKVVSADFLPIGSGLMFTLTGLFTLTMGPLFGSIRDITGSYDGVVLTTGGVLAIAAVFLLIACLNRRLSVDQKGKTENVTLVMYSISQTIQNR